MKTIIIKLIIFICVFPAYSTAQENPGDVKNNAEVESAVKLPVNVYDSFTFNRKNSPYIRTATYISGPAFMIIYGFTTWQWNAKESFSLKPETFKGAHAINGAADKFGHLYSNYISKRLFTFIFRATGSSKIKANIEGFILSEITSLGGELGDGFSHKYGFDPYDLLFNNFGILAGLLLDWSPFLDRIFAIKWEYYPSKQMRNKFDIIHHRDITTDYSGEKFILAAKFAGIPYLSLTPLRYVNFDIGYYSRGYRGAKYYASRTRHFFIGISINFSIAFGDLLPSGYASSTLQTFFNYVHPPWDYEIKDWVLSDRPHEDFDY